ncbi:maleylpyruvate isomerase family mycothiol-dependent enzyme [Streptomyces sp. p1417]|uniref:Maleylpyruvate isomerase family mycothiol-dependent enzyme n=1 Tax=Streptomyces typhae TaxID=2681492 RepID=A0A6L6X3N5_9ACTN|nr:maleylpyruvate isomerase family mycothiol-dependent enzyme [Streptomyces typhae]MVO88219.1 maleylpyruvate isomerase family mycothiol-dependent enzyme [Streptomyces typhae]
MGVDVDKEKVLGWVREERLSVAALLERLDDADWEAPSLCRGWTVRDVAAHLTLSTRTTWPTMLKGVIRARGDWERMEAEAAVRRAAAFSPAELIAQIRETAGSPKRAPMASPLDPLVDFLVHGQDIARPLGLTRGMPPEQTAAALGRVVSSPFYGARKRLRGVRLVATDLDWSTGDGPQEAQGPAADLLLLATGRPAGLTGVTGPGAERIAAAL